MTSKETEENIHDVGPTTEELLRPIEIKAQEHEEEFPVLSDREKMIDKYRILTEEAMNDGEDQLRVLYRDLARRDLFFLLIYVLKCGFANNDWVYARCREFEAEPNGYLDVWSREHMKSTIITLGAAVQKILNNPEETIGIFSFSRPIAKAFLRSIKTQFESNETLKDLFDDIMWKNPHSEAPKWSEDDGIVVRREGMPKEMTVEAWGLVDGMPTSKHYSLMIYDDVVEQRSVTSPEMIKKTTEAWELSLNLGRVGGNIWMTGTRYHYADTYSEIIRRGAAKLRLYTATVDGKFDGEPVLWTKRFLAKKIKMMGPYTASCQLFGKPIMEGEETFMPEWLQFWKADAPDSWKGMNVYILVDPANTKKKKSDYTSVWVFGTSDDNNYYFIDGIRDKLFLKERTQVLFDFVQKYRPKRVGYEKYGLQNDIEWIKERQHKERFHFQIVELGGSEGKEDRIKTLQPLFSDRRIFLPEKLLKTDYQKKRYDLVQSFINDEYLQFPYMNHDDMLDCMARITDKDMQIIFPKSGRITLDRHGVAKKENTGYDYDTYQYLEAP